MISSLTDEYTYPCSDKPRFLKHDFIPLTGIKTVNYLIKFESVPPLLYTSMNEILKALIIVINNIQ